MRAVDTNVVVRFLTGDDEEQYEKARRAFGSSQIFIPDTVILETEWVLRYVYEFEVESISESLKKLLGLPNVHVADPLLLHKAITWHDSGLDFADALHLAKSDGCEGFLSFDRKLVRKVGSSRVDLQACKLEYSIVSPK